MLKLKKISKSENLFKNNAIKEFNFLIFNSRITFNYL